VGQQLPVIGQVGGWWQITLTGRTGWIWGVLVTPNAAAQQAPQVKDLPPLPPTPTPAPTAAPSPQPVAQADLAVLGPETHEGGAAVDTEFAKNGDDVLVDAVDGQPQAATDVFLGSAREQEL
jgi:hypothetical protein